MDPSEPHDYRRMNVPWRTFLYATGLAIIGTTCVMTATVVGYLAWRAFSGG